jgi:ABC-2 type transport system ATP-binding protein
MLDDSSAGAIVVSNLSKSYGEVHAVRPIGLVIAAGETVALLGPNGAGKTTTFEMMLGLTRPDSGSVSGFGMSPAQAVKAGVVGGMLQTGAPLDYLRVRELVRMMASYYPRPLAVEEVPRLTGTDELAGRWASRLSGGRRSGFGSPPG